MRTAFCFDLDGTVSSLEMLPCIASELGISEEIATLTKLTMDGYIDFEESLRLRTLILGQIPLPIVQGIVKGIPLNDDLVSFINERPKQCFVVSGNLDAWVEPLRAFIKCEWFTSKALIDDASIKLSSVLDKGCAIREIRGRGSIERIVAIGDGSNDIPMFDEADVSVAFGAVHPPTTGAVHHATHVVHSARTLCHLLKGL